MLVMNPHAKSKTTPKKPIRILFLDVDGVLNCCATEEHCGSYRGIDDPKVKLLKEIIDATGALIVLISSWKNEWYRSEQFKYKQDLLANYLDIKLAKFGLKASAKVPDESFDGRGKNIAAYLKALKQKRISVASYAILDDEEQDYAKTGLVPHVVKTDFEHGGLKKEHVKQAIAMLLPQEE